MPTRKPADPTAAPTQVIPESEQKRTMNVPLTPESEQKLRDVARVFRLHLPYVRERLGALVAEQIPALARTLAQEARTKLDAAIEDIAEVAQPAATQQATSEPLKVQGQV